MNIRTLLLAAALTLPVGALAEDTAKPAEQEQATEAAPVKKAKACPASAATRIKAKPEEGCAGPKPFRSYSAEDLQTTGKIDVAEALRELDPIFR